MSSPGWFPSDDINPLWTDGGKTKETIAHLCEEIRLNGLCYKIALDPSFWQALGKALGWEKANRETRTEIWLEWKWNAHRFYDLVLTGGDTEKIWKELLNS
jgi:hypothetical protein